MPRILQDPRTEECPEFASAPFEAIRNIIVASQQVTAEQAAQTLTDAWTQAHATRIAAWDQQVQDDLALQEQERRAREEEEERQRQDRAREEEAERREKEKKKPKLNDFVAKQAIGDTIQPRPASFATKKLEDFDYIELWYFTEEGCLEASRSNRAVADDTFGLSKVDDVIALRPISSFKASTKVIQDINLDWRQMTMAKNGLLHAMSKADWPQSHVVALAEFFLNLEYHPYRRRQQGEQILITYQARVRREWHDALKGSEPVFDISVINDALLKSIGDEIWDARRAEGVLRLEEALAHTSSRPSAPSAVERDRGRARHYQAPARGTNPRRDRSLSPVRGGPSYYRRSPSPPSRNAQGVTESRPLHLAISLFAKVQAYPLPSRPAPYAWADTATTSRRATPPLFGMAHPRGVAETRRAAWSTPTASSYATTGNARMAAPTQPTTLDTNAPAAANRTTELSAALALRSSRANTPYKPEAWRRLLESAGILHKYPSLPLSLQLGFDAGVRPITETFTPPNKPSICEYANEFNKIVHKEYERGRHIGPFTRAELESIIGPFQTSPLDIIPKPGKPGKFRLVQNLSFPHLPRNHISSINSSIDSNLYPSTWGTFSVIALLIWRLPPGSQAAVRDVMEAYRTIPLLPSQWPGMVVRLADDQFNVDTSDCFGLSSGNGLYGIVGDAGAQLTRYRGIGPVSKWVDDHIFFRMLRRYLNEYNGRRRAWAQEIAQSGGEQQDGGRLWYKGKSMPDGRPEEFDEDCTAVFRDLSTASPRSQAEAEYTYCIADIDEISEELGIPWEVSKDIPFTSTPLYIGLVWDLEARTVTLPETKKAKYIKAIEEWRTSPTHTLQEAQKLYGKLLHACLVVPSGRAYLTNLETFLGVFHNSPFVPHTPPRDTPGDLYWWKQTLTRPLLCRPLPGPREIFDINAYSDASSEVGIGITIGDRWRAWRLLPGWKTDGRDIGWAEAVGFELLIYVILLSSPPGYHFKVFGDNRGVVEGWWKGRSRNKPTNEVFKRIHNVCEASSTTFHTRYVPSEDNPADKPSHGTFSSTSLLLPAPHIPEPIRHLIADFDADLSGPELRLIREGKTPKPLPKPDRSHTHRGRAEINNELERRGEELLRQAQSCSLTPALSPLRPHCLARDRLRLWKPAYTRPNIDNLGRQNTVTTEDVERINQLIINAWTPKTLESYGAGLLVYHVFCDRKDIPEEQRAPASQVLMASFVSSIAGAYAGQSVSNYLYGVRAWHILHGVPWSINEPEMEALLKAADKVAPSTSKRKKRRPYTPDFITAVQRHLDLNDPLDAAVDACLSTTFYTAARLGEFTVPRLDAFRPEEHIKPSDVRHETDRNGLKSTVFHIPRTKTQPIEGEDVSWSAQHGPTDPERSLNNHLKVNEPPANGHLFAYKYKNTHRPLTKPKFLQRLAKAARDADLDPLQGHGIRIGATLEYLLRGIPFDVVKVKGRWSSDAFILYLTKHAQILAPYMQAIPEVHETFTHLTMPRLIR
ncbi:putative tyrosine recombinase [Lyophyllum shimeji]|uniref:Tyrosine recombinase n=1 Tax=Lyophyllum shimeji TaxID=47721 RepID=A0A9P3PQT3_LYOSH|nr:putative tyrosine recombinase [Lyophyllum shimeji]